MDETGKSWRNLSIEPAFEQLHACCRPRRQTVRDWEGLARLETGRLAKRERESKDKRARAVDRANRAWHLAIYQPYQVVGLTSESGLSGWTGAGWGKAWSKLELLDAHTAKQCGASYVCLLLRGLLLTSLHVVNCKPMQHNHSQPASQSLVNRQRRRLQQLWALGSVLHTSTRTPEVGIPPYLRRDQFDDAARLIDSSSIILLVGSIVSASTVLLISMLFGECPCDDDGNLQWAWPRRFKLFCLD
jgi:hypothetical protein